METNPGYTWKDHEGWNKVEVDRKWQKVVTTVSMMNQYNSTREQEGQLSCSYEVFLINGVPRLGLRYKYSTSKFESVLIFDGEPLPVHNSLIRKFWNAVRAVFLGKNLRRSR